MGRARSARDAAFPSNIRAIRSGAAQYRTITTQFRRICTACHADCPVYRRAASARSGGSGRRLALENLFTRDGLVFCADGACNHRRGKNRTNQSADAGRNPLFAIRPITLHPIDICPVGHCNGMVHLFRGFNILEAAQPAMVSKRACTRTRGAAMGIYNTAQALGYFAGGAAGGWLFKSAGTQPVFWACAALALIWLMIAARMK